MSRRLLSQKKTPTPPPATKADVKRIEKNINQLTQATKADSKRLEGRVDHLAQTTKTDIKHLEQDMDNLAQATKQSFDRIEKTMATKDDLKTFATKDDLRQFKDEIVREFKVTAENIHQDVAGANRDEVHLIKQKTDDLDERVTVLEHQQGLR